MEVKHASSSDFDHSGRQCSSVQAIHLYRVDDQEIEFRLLCDRSDQRRTLARESVANLPLDARVSDRFEVEMLERRDKALDPFQRHHCISLIIRAKKPEPTLADLSGPEVDASYDALRAIFGSVHIEKTRQDQLDWYQQLQTRKEKGQGV